MFLGFPLAADYGAAQRRRRVFIFAYRKDTHYAKSLQDEPHAIIHKKGFFATAFPISGLSELADRTLEFTDIPEISASFKFEFANSGYMTEGKIHTARTIPLYEKPIPLSEIIEKNVDNKYYIYDNSEKLEYLKSAKKIQRVSKSGHPYIFSEGAIAFPDPLRLPARTILTSESSVNRSTHVLCDPETNKLRFLTPIEAERIQGFDDNWTNTGMPEKYRYFVMGNALVVPLITRMGQVLNRIFDNE